MTSVVFAVGEVSVLPRRTIRRSGGRLNRTRDTRDAPPLLILRAALWMACRTVVALAGLAAYETWLSCSRMTARALDFIDGVLLASCAHDLVAGAGQGLPGAISIR